mmetsp:Transcript_99079/g.285875  ORF Transcript_99079/g.285875 Transcript_99079/m.285875 type:complete len:81 (-) Transcript_99079:2396-2638(-)
MKHVGFLVHRIQFRKPVAPGMDICQRKIAQERTPKCLPFLLCFLFGSKLGSFPCFLFGSSLSFFLFLFAFELQLPFSLQL